MSSYPTVATQSHCNNGLINVIGFVYDTVLAPACMVFCNISTGSATPMGLIGDWRAEKWLIEWNIHRVCNRRDGETFSSVALWFLVNLQSRAASDMAGAQLGRGRTLKCVNLTCSGRVYPRQIPSLDVDFGSAPSSMCSTFLHQRAFTLVSLRGPSACYSA